MTYRFVHAADIHLDSPLRSLALRNPECDSAPKLQRDLTHESSETTQIYLHAHIALKEAALARVTPMSGQGGIRFEPDDKLQAFLNGL
ncbi:MULTISPECIES: hypothetical protein [Bosea]|uniref:Uncharacterized protein n=3 Tax=Bosea TaxID=85413 RepID=A0A927I277_9HYPH|nr:hypothetical protein [Bosea spartocytisi]MBD3847303.1 hypothetical protein [Bosea spartocytisi]MCT4475411.1 hypothetical protein [Bosea spartocytisi]PZR82185.1 MAG: hypothetical protein DI537_37070 [Stutzerimonas stutzeri]